MNFILAVVFFAVLVGIYIFLYLANKNTPVPKGCENLKADCEGCHDTACFNHPSHARPSQLRRK